MTIEEIIDSLKQFVVFPDVWHDQHRFDEYINLLKEKIEEKYNEIERLKGHIDDLTSGRLD